MRPALLDRLFAPVTVLPGIGAALARLIERAAGPLVVDLLWHLPTGIIDRRAAPNIGALHPRDWPAGSVITVKAKVERHQPGIGRRPYRVFVSDATGALVLVYFNVKGDYLQRLLPVGAERIVSGQIEYYDGMPQIAHPDPVVPVDEAERIRPIEPVYPLTAGLSSRVVAKAVAAGCERAPELPEWLDPALRERRQWPGWREALAAAHAPQGAADLDPETPARERLAYDEILASQLAVALVRARRRRRKGRVLAGTGELQARAEARLRLRADRQPASGAGRDRRRHEIAAPHDAAAAGRCRERQNRGRAAGDADRGRERRAGGAARADRGSCPAAPSGVDAARGAGRGRNRAADRARKGPGAQFDAGEPCLGADPGRRRHARAVAGRMSNSATSPWW